MTFKFGTNQSRDTLWPNFRTTATHYYEELVVQNGKTIPGEMNEYGEMIAYLLDMVV